ncbi:transcription factor TFIIIB component B'' [Microdochium nivale]|nr:transcription factor TFIIIB component B'' [Microdochium nivale]
MSSMLKKTGGLAFKPKALGRRGAPGPTPSSSQAATAATSTSTTRAPTTEPPQPAVEPPNSTPPPTIPSSQSLVPVVDSRQTEAGPANVRPADDLLPTPEPTQIAVAPSNPKPTTSSASRSSARRQSQGVASTLEPDAIVEAEVPSSTTDSLATTTAERRSPPPRQAQAETNASANSVAPDISDAAGSSGAPLLSDGAAAQEATAAAAPSKKKRSYTRRKPQASAVDGAEPSSAVNGVAAPRKRARSQGRKHTTINDPDATASIPSGAEGEASATTKPSKRRRRSPTPEDAINVKVDHTAVKMSELTRDLGIGVPFKHAEAIAERAREARNRARLRKLEKDKIRMGLLPDPGDDIHGSHKRDADQNAGKGRLGSSAPDGGDGEAPDSAGPGYIVVDGQIIINQQSLMIDNHASAENDISMMRTVVEDDFTHLTTSASFMRPSRVMGANSWTEDETEKFYEYLGMFGTDFETISHMFPGKNRRMVKLKFNREERVRPNRINAAVMPRNGRDLNIDLDHYKEKRTNWQEADEIMREHDALVAEHNIEVERLKAERRAQGLMDDDDNDDNNNNFLSAPGEKDVIANSDADAAEVATGGEDNSGMGEAGSRIALDEEDDGLLDLRHTDNVVKHTTAAIAATG